MLGDPVNLNDPSGYGWSDAAAGLFDSGVKALGVGLLAGITIAMAPAATPFLIVAGLIGIATELSDGYNVFIDPCSTAADKHRYLGGLAGGLVGSALGAPAGFGAGKALKGRFTAASSGAPLAGFLDGHASGQGFSGVLDPDTGALRLRPSTYENPVPDGYVSARGGHFTLSSELGGNPNNLGFTVFLQENGSLGVRWLSRSVNLRNPNFPGAEVPASFQGLVLDAITAATGRVAFSLE